MAESLVYNMDCMDFMRDKPDKFFDLAIVDPPYGLGIDGQKKSINKNPKHNRKQHIKKSWDNTIPDASYFEELFRVSKNQIIWGGNYFTDFLYPVKGWIFWYKGQNDLTMSDGELAWTSLPIVTRQFEINRCELIAQHTFHPTEKPIKLYKHIIKNYAKEGDTILDTHIGSGSSRIASFDMGFNFTGFEIDPEYFNDQEKRFHQFKSQLKMFV
jgi:site-specific DNA-methyltransferase (adenine-specific)